MDLSSPRSKTVLITGAAKGIGFACAQAFAKSYPNYVLALHYRSKSEELERLASEYSQIKLFHADLSSSGACQQLIDEIKASCGQIDILVNNAGMTIDKLLMMSKEDDFDTIMNVNLKPVFILSKLASKLMLKQRWGRIINISSVVGHTGNPGQSLYTATKGALTSFTKSVAQELAGAGITANCVAPGFIATAMTDKLNEQQKESILRQVPMKRVGEANEVAAAVVFLASDQASYITGSTLHVNGGMYS